jgi:hypothetical protein
LERTPGGTIDKGHTMSTDTRSTVKIVTFLLMLSVAALLLLAVAAGVGFTRQARADVIITYDLSAQTMTIDGVTPPVVGYVGTPQDGGDGRRLFQGIWFDGAQWNRINTREGQPSSSEPGWLVHYYPGDALSPVSMVMDMPAASITVTQTDGRVVLASNAIYPHPGDFNGDGAVTNQDIFDFLAAYFAGDPAADTNLDGVLTSQDLFKFLELWAS